MTGSIHGCVERTDGVPVGMGVRYREIGVTDVGQRTGSITIKISLLTDAPKHNLALMKISAWHRKQGDVVSYNMPLFSSSYRYASVLYEKNINTFIADEYGGPAFPDSMLPLEIENMKPDYSLIDSPMSLGYTFRPCWNTCGFCKVPKMLHPDTNHHSIWEFHDTKFNKICLLNNNTFLDTQWKNTFEEIWDAKLTVVDENGYDLRLLDDEKADAIKRTKWQGDVHFAWDRMCDEALIIHGIKIINKHKINNTRIYVLIGYDTTEKEDLHRCQVLVDNKQTPYIMPYNQSRGEKKFKRFIDTFMWRKYKTIEKAWCDYE